MKILVTGGSGFIGKNIVNIFKEVEHEVLAPTRQKLDLNDIHSVEEFTLFNDWDVTVHCAAVGLDGGTFDDYISNMMMLSSFKLLADKSSHSIVLGSGAEFGREKNVYAPNSPSFNTIPPDDFYGRFKQQQSLIVKSWENCTSIRVFGCFGPGEARTRLSYKAYHDNKVIIHKDKFMDYFYVKHLGQMMLDVFECYKTTKGKTYNACYKEKYSLKDFVNFIHKFDDKEHQIIIENTNHGNGYCGESNFLSRKYNLEDGVKDYIESKKNNKLNIEGFS